MANIRINSVVPDFVATTQLGRLNFHDYIEGKWAILFSHPKDFTPVCATELGRVSQLQPEFKRRNTVTVGLSVDSAKNHTSWIQDINEIVGTDLTYPIIADEDRKVAVLFDMLNEEHLDDKGVPVTVRSVFFIGPDKKIKAIITYPPSTGRNFDEIIRVIDSLQLTYTRFLATPADWTQGKDVVVTPKLTTEVATSKYGPVATVRPWLRTVADPGPTRAEDLQAGSA
jgi:alkyl hydroperoxide reductase subunit AhpC